MAFVVNRIGNGCGCRVDHGGNYSRTNLGPVIESSRYMATGRRRTRLLWYMFAGVILECSIVSEFLLATVMIAAEKATRYAFRHDARNLLLESRFGSPLSLDLNVNPPEGVDVSLVLNRIRLFYVCKRCPLRTSRKTAYVLLPGCVAWQISRLGQSSIFKITYCASAIVKCLSSGPTKALHTN